MAALPEPGLAGRTPGRPHPTSAPHLKSQPGEQPGKGGPGRDQEQGEPGYPVCVPVPSHQASHLMSQPRAPPLLSPRTPRLSTPCSLTWGTPAGRLWLNLPAKMGGGWPGHSQPRTCPRARRTEDAHSPHLHTHLPAIPEDPNWSQVSALSRPGRHKRHPKNELMSPHPHAMLGPWQPSGVLRSPGSPNPSRGAGGLPGGDGWAVLGG